MLRDPTWALQSDNWKTLSFNPAVNGYHFPVQEGLGSKRRRKGTADNYNGHIQEIQWAS